MARTALTPTTLPNTFPADLLLTTLGTVTAEAADATASPDGNKVSSSGWDLLLVDNSGGTARNITVTAAGNPATTITNYSVGAGEMAVLGPFPAKGWRFSDGLHINGAHADLLLTVLRLPPYR